jgi:uncharacterized protein (DUF952 family)
MGELLVHIAEGPEWRAAAAAAAPYVPAGFEADGFIHLSRPEQAHLPANALFGNRDGLVLLWIDAGRLTSEVRDERAVPGGAAFPHLYGPLDLDAVLDVVELQPWQPGSFRLPPRPA